MEKGRPTYDLDESRPNWVLSTRWQSQTSALRDAIALGFDRAGVVGVISGITRKMFVKSMTTFADHRVWQDVYHVRARDLVLYVKFQADVVIGFTVMSFKEK
ncbi:type II toxin-antitoxin system MqsR family toxin [Mesorhizobium ventifaucium]|nr:type II toxin-antitoxin system MqsR family toxin [Mesorhizobium ventifaucium]